MEDYKNLYQFLQSKGFKAIDKKDDQNWNNYYHLFTNGICDIRVSRPATFPTIDIRKSSALSVWYDLALVRDYLNKETKLSYHITLKEYMDFLENEMEQIMKLFETGNYLKMQREMDLLVKKRTKQIMADNERGDITLIDLQSEIEGE